MHQEMGFILVIEDEEDDALLISHAGRRTGVPRELLVLNTGRQALEYLSGQGSFQDRRTFPLPALMLLDLKMPDLTGFDILHWLQTRPDLQSFPAIVLSSSCSELDRQRALLLGARDYLVKPNAIGDLVQVLKAVHTRWLAEQTESASSG
jgi:CheY-like chemotaxis protein